MLLARDACGADGHQGDVMAEGGKKGEKFSKKYKGKHNIIK